ncbi:unnamed protein product [Dibothriocephalus latus]|uniref:Uncharacterized protein n=1 Tax=Dibothriocephalus latus TaxID=60516 RepID=A0A3P6T240_DIBLA|nr:unnamed protein product [Dibothriocephalus latus]
MQITIFDFKGSEPDESRCKKRLELFPATTLQAFGASNSNADVVGESGRLRLLTMSGDRVPSELARRASELLAEAEDSAHVDDNGSRAAVDRTVRARRLPFPPHLNNPPPASSVLRVANSLSAGGDGVRPQQKGVPCSTQAQSTPIGTFTHAVRDRPSDANTVTNKIRVTDYNNGFGVGCLSSSLTRGAHTVADSKQQKAMQAAAANATGPTVRHPISNDRINPPHSGENADHNAHRKYLTSLSARNHAHFSSRADPCTQEALCKARISANRTRRLLNLEAVGDPAAGDSESPFTPSTDDETLGTLPGGDDDRWFCLEASSDEVGSADKEAAVVSDQFEPDPLRFMSVYRQKCRLAAPALDATAHMPCKPNAEVPTGDATMTPEVAIPRPISRTVVDATANHNHRDSESITSTALDGTTRTKSSHNSSARSTLSTSNSQSAGGAKHIFVGSLPTAPTGPPRLTAAALGLSLTANVNRLDALAASIEQLQGMESLRQLSLAQAESVSLAQLIQCGQVKESFGINQPASTNRQPSELITSNQNHRTVKEEDPRSVDLQTRKPVAVVSSSCGSSQNESSAAVISTSISARNTSNTSSSRIVEITHTTRPSSAQDSTLRTSSANASLVLDSDVGAVSEAIQSVADVSNYQLDPGISVRTSRQTSVLPQEAEPQIVKSQLTHHVFPKALDRPSLADKSLNTTNDRLTAIEALDQPAGETSKTAKAEKAVDASDFGGQILRLDSEDYKGLYKLRAEELKRRKHKAQLVMLLSERLALQESEVVQLESKALQVTHHLVSHADNSLLLLSM